MWNVGIFTDRSKKLAEVLRRRNMNICCLPIAKNKVERRENEIGEEYKIIYLLRKYNYNRNYV